MKPSTKFVLALLAIASIISLVHVISSILQGPDSSETVAARTVADPNPPVMPPDPQSEALTHARIHLLEKQTEYREKAQRAASRTPAARTQAAAQIQSSWTAFIQSNRAKYSTLVEQARQDPHKSAHCTICNGLGDLPCLMCKQHPGKCISCGGTGFAAAGEFCPTCQGTGKCYLCAGLGRMNCTFCNDGVIATDSPPLPVSPPIF